MDIDTVQGNSTQVSSSNKKPSVIFLLLGFLLIFAVGIFVGLWSGDVLVSPRITQETTCVSPQEVAVAELKEQLPVDTDLLQNPIVYEWRGSVRGKLISKDEHTFTIEDEEGNTITISDITPEGEIFETVFRDTTNPDDINDISRADIPIGANLLGEFWIFEKGKNSPVGGSFSVKY